MAGIIQDPYGRILEYVRISVTDRCNYRCRYCMPSEGVEWIPHEEIMSYENILFLCEVFVELGV
ncbi:MAG: GTP 3',8-cyclase MoaA, partial [Aminobacteriaceae bacterium]